MPQQPATIRVAPWRDDQANPYQRLFYAALAPHGVSVTSGLTISDDALGDLGTQLDVIHLHWPEYLWRVHGNGVFAQMRLIVGMARFLRLARRLGIRVWWTAHNLAPHEGHPLVNYLGYRVVAAYADLVIAHSHFAANEMKRRYSVRNVVVMRIGNFADTYPCPRPRADVVSELGLDPALPLVSCLGAVRAYKGIVTALDAVAMLKGRVQLLIAGDPDPTIDMRALESRAREQPWTRVLLRRLSDQEFADFTSASDAIVLSYLRATTSSLMLAAWTLGRGVVASDLPCFADELADFPGAGMLAPAGDSVAFANAIDRYLSVPAASRTAAALEAAAAHDWARCVLPVVEAMHRS
jgi:glycosyltransferase involved in cell wall biosynthesis